MKRSWLKVMAQGLGSRWLRPPAFPPGARPPCARPFVQRIRLVRQRSPQKEKMKMSRWTSLDEQAQMKRPSTMDQVEESRLKKPRRRGQGTEAKVERPR